MAAETEDGLVGLVRQTDKEGGARAEALQMAVKSSRRHLGAGAWHLRIAVSCSGEGYWRDFYAISRTNDGQSKVRAGGSDVRGRYSEESPGSQGSEPGASRRGWSLKVLAGGFFRLGVPYDGCEPEEMAVEGYQVRSHQARRGLSRGRAGEDGH